MTEPVYRTMTEEEYLRWDGPRDAKWEYVDGFIYAQAGATRPHNTISTNIQRVFIPAADARNCSTFVSDLKVRIYRDGRPRYYLPDVVVVCNSNSEGDIETQPCLIVEILSASTRAVDETFKASDYQRLESLQGYLLVDSERQGVMFHRRTAQGWQLEAVDESVQLPCLDVSLSVEAIYRNVPL
ncbi:Uma2 family endonuclease [Deinococcus sp. AJ005]|uniref:Uma2 family endonuclease n=1 Tax=Deinococcus sp. AJ005 TaxID=2652443 RepID=UPI00125CCBD8|nr:Uma2 family endonuclease [Deinococcus sp. AJ005]QFP77118.1 Uma2 family endonuclease [Deinococcus sp. AJ005]